jgi:tetratricopeptide (TPR) repeat protein
MPRLHKLHQFLIFTLILGAGLLLLYATGFKNQFIFDDSIFTDGRIFGQYGGLLPLKPRLLSYGSFVWIDAIWSQSWAVQRAVNTLLHLATALSMATLVYQLLKNTRLWGEEFETGDHVKTQRWAASGVAAAIWAFHPVAVYGVGYLTQRSIIMATLFVTLALLSLVIGLQNKRPVGYALALGFFALAMASKEYAITALLLVPVFYIYIRQPGIRQIAITTFISFGLLALVGGGLFLAYGDILGQVFDETSRAFALQLEQAHPGITDKLYPLSIINQASLFWRYGLTWFVPMPSLMAIDIRPVFPVQYLAMELVGAIAYLATIVAGLWVLIRRQDAWRLVALAVLVPALLFATEFLTVWIQDPFVLYRSYLWSLGLPILLAIPLAYVGGKAIVVLALASCLSLAALSYGRIDSLYSARSVWADAAAKIDLKAPANAVGRWRPFMNLGADALDRGDYAEAQRLFKNAIDLGEPLGSAHMNMGVTLQQLKQHEPALAQFAQAQAKGFLEPSLFFHLGESYFATRAFDQAIKNFNLALAQSPNPEVTFMSRVRRAEASTAMGDFDAAIADYTVITADKPDAQRYSIGLAMAYNGKKDHAQALQVLNPIIAARPTAAARYARALTYFQMGNRKASQEDLTMALNEQPQNPVFQHLARQLQTPATTTKP